MTTARRNPLPSALCRVALALAVLAGLAAVGPATPASASSRDAETITRKKGFEGSYPALTAGTSTNPDPARCMAVTFCDTIPLVIEVPDIPLGDDYYVQVDVTWDVPELYDLDIYFFDDGQTQEEARANGTSDPTKVEPSPYTLKASNTLDNPASLIIAEPRLIRYNLVINNASLSDVAYKVKAYMVIAKFKRPFEVLDDPNVDITEQMDPPVDTSGDAPTPTPITDQSGLEFGPETPTLDEVQPLDDELDSLRRAKKDDDSGEVAGALPTGNDRPPGPASGLALLFWLAIVPGSMLGGLAFWLLKRRRAGFSFG